MTKMFLKYFSILLIISGLSVSCRQNQSTNNSAGGQIVQTEAQRNPDIPSRVFEVYDYIKQHHQAPEGYVGGRHFGNFEGHLPNNSVTGGRINYQEWDVNPHLQHKNRGTERIITGSDGRAYYTNNHYQSFIEIK